MPSSGSPRPSLGPAQELSWPAVLLRHFDRRCLRDPVVSLQRSHCGLLHLEAPSDQARTCSNLSVPSLHAAASLLLPQSARWHRDPRARAWCAPAGDLLPPHRLELCNRSQADRPGVPLEGSLLGHGSHELWPSETVAATGSCALSRIYFLGKAGSLTILQLLAFPDGFYCICSF